MGTNADREAAGGSTRRMARHRYVSAVTVGVVVFLAVVIMGIAVQYHSALGFGGGAVLILLAAMSITPLVMDRRLDVLLEGEKRANRGAEAEEEVGRILVRLGSDFLVLHDIETPFGNIDHILISKISGAYVLETKSHRGSVEIRAQKLLLNGKGPEKDFVGQCLRNTFWLRAKITEIIGEEPWVTALLVFTNASVPPRPRIKGVRVVNKGYIRSVVSENGRKTQLAAPIWAARGRIEERLRDPS